MKAAFRSMTYGLLLTRDLCLAIAAVAAILPLWWLPWRAATLLSRLYARVAFICWPHGRRIGMINLRRAYGPSMTRAEARRFIRRVFENLAQSIAEGLQFARRYKHGQEGWTDCYSVEDPEIEARILNDPRPKVFVTGHLGSWEIATIVLGIRTHGHGAIIVRRVDNPFLNALVRLVRLREPGQWIEKHGAVTEALTRLRQGDSIALLVDENAGWRGLFVNFFGRPASTGKTAALLSLMTGAPIVLGAVVRRADGALVYKLATLEAPLDRGPLAVRELTQQIMTQWESWVRAYPEQWRWIHWRWKCRPDGTEERYKHRDLVECFRGAQPAFSVSEKDVTETT